MNKTKSMINSYKRAYLLLPHGSIKRFQEDLIAACGWRSDATFRATINGKRRIRPPEKAVIVAEFAKYNINAETGEFIVKEPMEKAVIPY